MGYGAAKRATAIGPTPTGQKASSVTEFLRDWQQGSEAAGVSLVNSIYGELKRLARMRLRAERSGHTLQPTALVNEAWLRLSQIRSEWQNREQFLGMAAVAMRRILVEHARRRDALKRGQGSARVSLDDVPDALVSPMPDDRLLALDEALTRLGAMDARQARVVELRYFSGLSIDETAAVLEISTGTVKREWTAARAWLFDEIRPSCSSRLDL